MESRTSMAADGCEGPDLRDRMSDDIRDSPIVL
jgi:hypothetical protein